MQRMGIFTSLYLIIKKIRLLVRPFFIAPFYSSKLHGLPPSSHAEALSSERKKKTFHPFSPDSLLSLYVSHPPRRHHWSTAPAELDHRSSPAWRRTAFIVVCLPLPACVTVRHPLNPAANPPTHHLPSVWTTHQCPRRSYFLEKFGKTGALTACTVGV
jgi:hypothetical protein